MEGNILLIKEEKCRYVKKNQLGDQFSLATVNYQEGGVVSDNDPIHPIAQTGRAPVTISN